LDSDHDSRVGIFGKYNDIFSDDAIYSSNIDLCDEYDKRNGNSHQDRNFSVARLDKRD